MFGDPATLRDYGRDDPSMNVVGSPVILNEHENDACPHCGCKRTFLIKVQVTSDLLGGPGVGVYVGCAACPWASPMISRRKLT